MAIASQPKTTIGQHLTGVGFLAGAILLVGAAFGLLLVAPVMLALDGYAHWRRGSLDFFIVHNFWLFTLVVIAWIIAISMSVLMSGSERLHRSFERSFPLTLHPGEGRLTAGRATAQDVAAHLLRETAAKTSAFTFSDVIEEDYGAGFWAHAGEDGFWVAVGVVGDDVSRPEGRFIVNASFDPGLSLLRRLRRRPDDRRFKELAKLVGAAVRTLRPRARDA
jgi:hypothetical protein